MDTQLATVTRKLEQIGALALLALPLLLALAFLLHFTSINDFLNFQLTTPGYSAEHFLQTLKSADGGFRYFVLPHLVGYAALPLFVFSALIIALISYKRSPKLVATGFVTTVVGVIFLAGVFSAWLSFAAINQLENVPATTLVAVLKALTSMQGPLLLSTVLSSLALVGMILLGIALHRTQCVPRWSSLLYITGNIMIIAFMDLDNWMLIGAILQCIGIAPLALKIMLGQQIPYLSEAQSAS